MDSKPDNHDPDLPPVGSAEDLEEALKWLEDLTARQSKATDLSNPVPAASLDSPFRGLIDDAEGDLPDWLREAPAPPADHSYNEADPESRLDWLAKMAQRESIEELPTLEWRHLSEPVQSAIIARSQEPQDIAPDTPPVAEDATEPVTEAAAELPPQSLDESEAAAAEEVIAAVEWAEPPAATADDVIIDEGSPVEPAATETDIVAAAEEELRLEIEAGEELPPLDDLDAAMAWIEELAASQDAPIEDIPSVADRALASKLMMEAGLSSEGSILDELGSDSGLVEGLTPTHPFIEEEDFADTVVLVETIAADQGITLEEPESSPEVEVEAVPAAPELPATPGLDEFVPSTAIGEEPEELSFEDAMAILDDIAVAQQSEAARAAEPLAKPLIADEEEGSPAGIMAAEALAVGIIKATGEESAPLSASDAPWNEAADVIEPHTEGEEAALVIATLASEPERAETQELEVEAAETEPPAPATEDVLALSESPNVEAESEVVATGAIEQDPAALEAALVTLDALALPAGRTLSDLDARLQAAQLTPWRDMTSALDWLESALSAQPPAGLVAGPDGDAEAGWFDRMPEDPDAVLAWLEQMAAAEGNGATPPTTVDSAPVDLAEVESVTATTSEIGEADLLAMPEDPDEAMAWLESLAHGGPPPRPAAPEPNEPVEDEAAAVPEGIEPVVEELTSAEAAPVVEAEAVAPASVAPVAEDTPPPPKKPRGRPRKAATPSAIADAEPPAAESAEPAAEAEPPSPPTIADPEAAAEPPPTAAKPKKSWVDLLKPLD